MVATSFVLSALRSKAYRSVSGVATEENRFNVTPKVDFRLSQMRNNNAGGMAGKTSNATAEVVMNWNLYSGGADSARVEQYVGRLGWRQPDSSVTRFAATYA
jgi:hypothetical protein